MGTKLLFERNPAAGFDVSEATYLILFFDELDILEG